MNSPKRGEFLRRFETSDPRVLLAYRAFRYGKEGDLISEQEAATEALTLARVAHEKAQKRLDAANSNINKERDWFARDVLRACGQPEPDRLTEEAIVYTSGGEVVVAVSRLDVVEAVGRLVEDEK